MTVDGDSGRQRLLAALASVVLVAAACSPAPPRLRPPLAIYLLVQAKATNWYPLIGPTLGSRGPTTVRAVSLGLGVLRTEASVGESGRGLDMLPDGRLARLTTRAGSSELSLLDPRTLQRVAGFPLTAEADDVRIDPQGEFALVVDPRFAWLVPLVPDGAPRRAELGALPDTESCGLSPVPLFARDGRPVLAGVCRSNVRPGHYVVLLDRGGGATAVYPSPADEFDAPYALSPAGDVLFVASPQHQEVWALRLADGTVRWRSGYGSPPTDADPHKRIAGANAIVVSADGSRLYVTSTGTVGPARGIWVMNASSGANLGRWLPEIAVTGIALTWEGDRLLATSPVYGGSLIAIDTQDGKSEVLAENLATASGPRRYMTVVGLFRGLNGKNGG